MTPAACSRGAAAHIPLVENHHLLILWVLVMVGLVGMHAAVGRSVRNEA